MTDINKLEEETQKEINEMLASLEKQEKAVEAVPSEAKAEPPVEAKEASAMQEFHGESGDSSLDETVGSLKVEEEPANDKGVLATVTSIRPTVTGATGSTGSGSGGGSSPSSMGGSVQPGSLQMKLSGSMSLELTYETGGETVTVSFTDDAFVVTLGTGGAEFRLPMKKSGKAYKAA